MKYEFRHNGTTKLVISPQNSIEEILIGEIFSDPDNVEIVTVPNSKEIIIQKKPKPE